jgi:hypothetical protein
MSDYCRYPRVACSGMTRVFAKVVELAWILSLTISLGCTPILRREAPTLSGTFRGNTSDGRSVKVTLIQDENTVTGRGLIGEKVFSLSAIISYHGPMILTFDDGTFTPAYLMLSSDGDVVTIQGIGPSMALDRGGDPIRTHSGPFAGRYSSGGPPALYLNLTQGGELLAGTGFVEGKAIAVVGKTSGPNHASGTLLFSDESQQRIKVRMSDDSKILTIDGLGAPIEITRQ